ncbi:MAG: helix-turn-helix domain-containing protein [Acidobacteria bacterium]|nr:helix-turn-helix domain-containing protein [Acidobacteriota bacterium]
MPTDQLEDLITQAEAARLRNVSREAIYGLVARGKLGVVEIGGQKFVRRSEVEGYQPEVGGRPKTQAARNRPGVGRPPNPKPKAAKPASRSSRKKAEAKP